MAAAAALAASDAPAAAAARAMESASEELGRGCRRLAKTGHGDSQLTAD